ncbi:MAG: 5-(carboxyamino)imidazole ribonucleotide mutase, partial [Acutalibacter sp.]|nr:5-(carboxyamino)imidazole ribonucleotide mutase [Acutalibacter sp.]
AALLAAQILALGDESLAARLLQLKEDLRLAAQEKDQALQNREW